LEIDKEVPYSTPLLWAIDPAIDTTDTTAPLHHHFCSRSHTDTDTDTDTNMALLEKSLHTMAAR
jgi:hypothetical protein